MSELSELKRRIGRLERGRGRRYPASLRERIERYVTARREFGYSWDSLSAELGIPAETMRRWQQDSRGETGATLVPVEVVDAVVAERTVAVVSPSGWRLEGLGVAEAVAVLRALS